MSKLDKIPEAVRDLKTDGEAAFMQALLEIEPDEDIMSCEYCEYYRVKADRFGRKCRIDYCPCLKLYTKTCFNACYCLCIVLIINQ